jgi:hypothetical protein
MDELDGLSAATLLSTASDWISALTVPPPVTASANANSPHDKRRQTRAIETATLKPERDGPCGPYAAEFAPSKIAQVHKAFIAIRS